MFRFSIAALMLALVSCAGPSMRPAVTVDTPTPYREDAEGPPRPPDRGSLVGLDDAPRGESLGDGLPFTNARVNQDASGEPQNETTIIADPTNAQRLVGAWNDYFNVNPGQNTVIGYGWTTDGGASWQSSRVNFGTLPASQSTGDPALTADATGIFYLGVLAYSGTASGILVARSTDGGVSFQEPVRLDNGGDKEFLTVDPANNNVYVVWENGGTFGQTIYFSKSTDQGLSYTPRRAISGSGSTGNGAYPVVGPDGDIYVIWSNFGSTIYFDRSLDDGVSWLDPDRTVNNQIDAPRSPLNGGFRNPQIPAIAVDRTNGPFRDRIYVVWGDERLGDPDILISYSGDKGDTWSAPLRVNDDVIGNDADQFFPWVTVDASGAVHVTFLDRREDPSGLLLAMYLATSTDGGASFGPNVRVSDGIWGPSGFGFLGDYTGAAITADGRIVPHWPDGRNGDEDVFAQSVDLADYDADGVLNDGDGDGQYASFPCTGGQSTGCDDNCPGTPNVAQVDGDGDLIGDLCDNCPADANTDQFDLDRDGIGDVCDQCPGQVGGDASDPDLDGVANCTDNCPNTVNPGQEDQDGDGLGDVCDFCPATALNDADGDGLCGDVDNCPDTANPGQQDQDADGAGNLCDVCPLDGDPGQADQDGDGRGDACDCEPADPNDREPAEAASLTVTHTGGGSVDLGWTTAAGADVYAVTRGTLSSLGPTSLGSCFAEGVVATGLTDGDVPASGEGFTYLIQGQSYECGFGSLGFDSAEGLRANTDPGACVGQTFTDDVAVGETAVEGIVTGTFADTQVSDNGTQSIQEVISSGGKPSLRYSLLEHHWDFVVTGGSRVELHVEGFRTSSSDGDDFVFEYSDDAGLSWNPVSLSSLPFADDDTDRVGTLPGTLAGSITIRVLDTNRAQGTQGIDSVSIDRLWIRSVP